ncbi:MAG: hypothetical protein AAB527_01170 [Patescibacteria group bacterium]
MDLDRNKWYVRWFFWSLGICDEFTGGCQGEYHNNGTNLCHFCRVIFLYAPAVLLLHITLIVFALAVLIPFPISYFGGSGYLRWLGVIVLMAFIIRALKIFLRWFSNLPSRPRKMRKPEKPVEYAGPSFLELVWEWLVAQKKKICPIIRFVDARTGEVKNA